MVTNEQINDMLNDLVKELLPEIKLAAQEQCLFSGNVDVDITEYGRFVRYLAARMNTNPKAAAKLANDLISRYQFPYPDGSGAAEEGQLGGSESIHAEVDEQNVDPPEPVSVGVRLPPELLMMEHLLK